MRDARRIIDASANRAREALRVMEDAARFLLDDADLARALKQARHDLAHALDALPGGARALPLTRDTPRDVGATIVTDDEHRRSNSADVAAAAAKRAAEALRSIEETAKVLAADQSSGGTGAPPNQSSGGTGVPPNQSSGGTGVSPVHPPAPSCPAQIESIRYRVYELERRLALALSPSARAASIRLCVLVSESLCGGRDWLEVARLAAAGGADAIQLREKDLPARELLDRARRLVDAAKQWQWGGGKGGEETGGGLVLINDRPDVAALAEADGVHLGQTDLPPDAARRIVGPDRLVGVSATTLDQARAARAAGADYCGVGPMFATTTKQHPGGRTDGSLAGPDLLRAYLAADPPLPPHLAIGGIDAARARELAASDCRAVAVSAAVCRAPDPAAAAADIRAALDPSTPAPAPAASADAHPTTLTRAASHAADR